MLEKLKAMEAIVVWQKTISLNIRAELRIRPIASASRKTDS